MALSRLQTSKFGALMFLFLGLASAGAAALAISHMMKSGGYTRGKVRPVIVAAHNLVAGKPMTPKDVVVRDWPEASMPPGVYTSPKKLFAGDSPPIPVRDILKGEPVVKARLAKPNEGPGISALLREGYRAVVVKVDDSVARAGLVYPGALVDVVATLREGSKPPVSRIVIQKVRVLAIGSQTDVANKPRSAKKRDRLTRSTPKGEVVTLEVIPYDVEVLSMAMREGKVDLALRSATDDTMSSTRGITPSLRPPMDAVAISPEGEQATDKAPARAAGKRNKKGQ